MRDDKILLHWLWKTDPSFSWDHKDLYSSQVVKWLKDKKRIESLKSDVDVARVIIFEHARQWLKATLWGGVLCFDIIWLHMEGQVIHQTKDAPSRNPRTSAYEKVPLYLRGRMEPWQGGSSQQLSSTWVGGRDLKRTVFGIVGWPESFVVVNI
ncbi:MAG: hypothetical protein Q9166_002382 [cf. Caloplaca sp. 2 TL-2023]